MQNDTQNIIGVDVGSGSVRRGIQSAGRAPRPRDPGNNPVSQRRKQGRAVEP